MSSAENLRRLVFGDLERELTVTRRVLAALPADRFEWKPHPKSMTLGQLAKHVVNLVEWMRASIGQDVLDFAQALSQQATELAPLLDEFDRNAAALREAIARFDFAGLTATWTLRNGDQVIVARPRDFVFRTWSANHLIHHRGQLCVLLRLLDVPVPVVYFTSVDNPGWHFE